MNTPAQPLQLAILSIMITSCLNLPASPVEQVDRPSLLVTESNIYEGQVDVPTNATFRLTFNQPLDPGSLEGTEVTLESGKLKMRGRKKYDLLSRTLTFVPDGALRAKLWYRFVLKSPPLSIMGTRSLEDEIAILFRTGDGPSGVRDPPPATVDFEKEIFPRFASGCSCHGAENPIMNARFIFDTPEDFLGGAVATDSMEWKNWKIINPGIHEKSYLMYKLLGDERLGLPTITGERMPPTSSSEEIEAGVLEKIRDWIEQGAGSGK